MLTLPAWATPSPSNEKGRPGKSGQSTIFNNTDANEDNDRSPEKQPRKPTLFPKPTGAAAEWLMITPLLFSNGDLVKAQRFYEDLIKAREEWLRVMRRRLPSEEQLDRERYGRPRREMAR
jgi:hypothetical protein